MSFAQEEFKPKWVEVGRGMIRGTKGVSQKCVSAGFI